MSLKKYRTKLTRQFVEALHTTITALLNTEASADEDKMHFAVLAEIKHSLYVKLDSQQLTFSFSFSPAQAFALRILSTDYVQDRTSYTGNQLHIISNEVHRLYQ